MCGSLCRPCCPSWVPVRLRSPAKVLVCFLNMKISPCCQHIALLVVFFYLIGYIFYGPPSEHYFPPVKSTLPPVVQYAKASPNILCPSAGGLAPAPAAPPRGSGAPRGHRRLAPGRRRRRPRWPRPRAPSHSSVFHSWIGLGHFSGFFNIVVTCLGVSAGCAIH